MNAGSTGVIETNDWGAGFHGEVHDLADLAGVSAGEGASVDGEVLGEDEDGAAVDEAATGDDAVPGDFVFGHAKVLALVSNKAVDFFERAGVEEELDALSRGHLAFFVLPGNASGAAGFEAFLTKFFEALEPAINT